MFSRGLSEVDWPGLTVIADDAAGFLRQAKQSRDEEIRIIGSLSLMRTLTRSGDLDLLRLIICPLALPETGIEPVFDGMGDIQFDLINTRVLDDRIVMIDYAPNGKPPRADH